MVQRHVCRDPLADHTCCVQWSAQWHMDPWKYRASFVAQQWRTHPMNLKATSQKAMNRKVMNRKVVNLTAMNLKVTSQKVMNQMVVNLKAANPRAMSQRVANLK